MKNKVTNLAKLMSDTLYTWCDEELIDLFLDDSITWEENNKTFCSRSEKITYLENNGFDLDDFISQ